MKREIIRPFSVWDRQLCSQVELPAGIVVSDYRIVRGRTLSEEPYGVEFQACGSHYFCALYTFLPRTQSVSTLDTPVAREPAGHVMAV